MRILGIDPGTIRLGYGVVDHLGPGRQTYVDCGTLTAPARASRETRLLTIGRDLRELLAELAPDVVAMEQAFFGKNVQATLALGEARGVALFVAQEYGQSRAAERGALILAGYPPAQVKQVVTGRGAASKGQIAFFVRALLKLRREPAADAADALAIALCHARVGLAVGGRAARATPAPAEAAEAAETAVVRSARGAIGGARARAARAASDADASAEPPVLAGRRS